MLININEITIIYCFFFTINFKGTVSRRSANTLLFERKWQPRELLILIGKVALSLNSLRIQAYSLGKES